MSRVYSFNPDKTRRRERHLLMTGKGAKVLAFIEAEIAAGRRFPSAERISAHMGWQHPSGARDCVRRLARIGAVRRIDEKRFAWELVTQ